MSLFSSDRERRLWLWALAVVVAIYCSLGPAGTLAEALREHDLLGPSFAVGFLLVIGAIAGIALRQKPGPREIWVALGVAAVYGMLLTRMGGYVFWLTLAARMGLSPTISSCWINSARIFPLMDWKSTIQNIHLNRCRCMMSMHKNIIY